MDHGSYLICGLGKSQNLLCIQENVFGSQRHLFLRWKLAWVLSVRRERERGFLEGGGRPRAEAEEHVYKLKARQVLFPTPITSHITLEGWQVPDHSAGRQQTLRAEGVNSALSWAPLLTNLSSLNQAVSHWNNLMERNLCPREKQVDPDGLARGIKWDQVAINPVISPS